MSLEVQTRNGIVEAKFIGLIPIDGVQIGEYSMSLEEFSVMAMHFLGGGWFGWYGNKTPESVDKAISHLFKLYEQVDGKWVRKAEHQVEE